MQHHLCACSSHLPSRRSNCPAAVHCQSPPHDQLSTAPAPAPVVAHPGVASGMPWLSLTPRPAWRGTAGTTAHSISLHGAQATAAAHHQMRRSSAPQPACTTTRLARRQLPSLASMRRPLAVQTMDQGRRSLPTMHQGCWYSLADRGVPPTTIQAPLLRRVGAAHHGRRFSSCAKISLPPLVLLRCSIPTHAAAHLHQG